MEIDITEFFNNAAPRDYSASRAELGDDAGRITWSHAVEDAPDYPLLDTDEKRDAFRDHVRQFGAWSDDEIAAWSNDELTALFLQFIAGDIREVPGMAPASWDWAEYERLASDGVIGGRMFQAADGRIYYTLGE